MFQKTQTSLILLLICASVLLFFSSGAYANNQQKTVTQSGLNPMDQRFGSEQDVEITRKIREKLTGMNSLSLSAQNVKIVTLGKKVNLIGEVNSEKERVDIIQVAKSVAGNDNVRSEIIIQK